jgi:hypothetical protein
MRDEVLLAMKQRLRMTVAPGSWTTQGARSRSHQLFVTFDAAWTPNPAGGPAAHASAPSLGPRAVRRICLFDVVER